MAQDARHDFGGVVRTGADRMAPMGTRGDRDAGRIGVSTYSKSRSRIHLGDKTACANQPGNNRVFKGMHVTTDRDSHRTGKVRNSSHGSGTVLELTRHHLSRIVGGDSLGPFR